MKLPIALIFTSMLCSTAQAQYLQLPEQYHQVSPPPVIREAPQPAPNPFVSPVDSQYIPQGLEAQPTFTSPAIQEYTPPVAKPMGGEVVLLNPPVEAPFPYLSGGIGADEVESMKAQKDNYNLHIMSADKAGFFTGEFKITIKDAKGANLFSSEGGPLFYAKLPNGTYNVTGERDGVSKSQKISINVSKPAHIHFGW